MSSDPAHARTVDLSRGAVPIGRASAKDGERAEKPTNLYFRNSHVSKSHARVWRRDGAVVLEDAGSTFGTVYNNNLLVPGVPVELAVGDAIGLVINRPLHVLQGLVAKKLALKMVPLDKLLNPKVQVTYIVHALDAAAGTLVLVPGDVAELDVRDDATFAEVTPEGPAYSEMVQVDSSDDDSAPLEEKIEKEILSAILDDAAGSADVEVVIDAAPAPEEHYEIDVDDSDDDYEHDDEPPLCACAPASDSCLVDLVHSDAESSEPDDTYIEEGIVYLDNDDSSDDNASDDNVSDNIEDLSDSGLPNTMELVFFDDDSSEDSKYRERSDEYNSDLDTPSGEDSESARCCCGESSDCDSVYEDDAIVCGLALSECLDCNAHAYGHIADWCQDWSKKRTRDEAELSDDEPETDVPAKKAKNSTLRTVLKEVGKGLLYVTGTLAAVIAYGRHLDN